MAKLTIQLKLAWWFKYLYLPCLILTLEAARLTNPKAEVNKERLDFWIRKAVKINKPQGKIMSISNMLKNQLVSDTVKLCKENNIKIQLKVVDSFIWLLNNWILPLGFALLSVSFCSAVYLLVTGGQI